MKKVLAILLATLMLLTVVPMAAFAKVSNDDVIVNEIIDGDYAHITYTKSEDYFKKATTALTVLPTYQGAWVNGITKDKDVANAETLLLSLIERIEAEYNNETYEKILSVLSGVKKGADVITKIDSYTHVLDLAENSTWATSLEVVGYVIKAGNMANDAYETYVQAYANILSIQAASIYYADFLDYIIANCADNSVKKAATNVKEDITKDLEAAKEEILKAIIADAAQEGATVAIKAAMSANTVTAVLKTVYSVVGTVSDKLFKTEDLFQYMSCLAMLTRIEDVIGDYAKGVLASEDELASAFVINAVLTLRETGEGMLKKLSLARKDSYGMKALEALKIIDTSKDAELIKEGALASAKLSVYRDIIAADADITVYKVEEPSYVAGKNAVIKNSEGKVVFTIKSASNTSKITSDGAFYSMYDSDFGSYIKVIALFGEGYDVSYTAYTNSSGSGKTSGGSSSGFGSIFSGLFKALSDFFANLFKAFKF